MNTRLTTRSERDEVLDELKRIQERAVVVKTHDVSMFTTQENESKDNVVSFTVSAESRLADFGVGKRYQACSLENYKGNDKLAGVCRKIVEDPKDVLFTGGTGTGKTHLAVAILRGLVESGKAANYATATSQAIFVTVPDLLLTIRDAFGGDRGRQTEYDIVEKYVNVPYLVLDDLGAEKSTEWSIATLYVIIDARYRERKPTIVTTNLSLDRIRDLLSPRIASRLSESQVIKLTAKDYRTKRTQE